VKCGHFQSRKGFQDNHHASVKKMNA